MEDSDVVKLLQHYRHDLMNHLQIVNGYMNLKRPEKAEEKIKETMEYYHEERKLMHVMPPQFILWVMQVNIMFDHIKLEYQILTEKKLHHVEHDLSARCEKVISAVNKTIGTDSLHDISLQIKDAENEPCCEVSFLIKGESSQEAVLSNYLNDDSVDVRQTQSGLECSFLIQ
ncbi:Spo0B domain-containing protein [Virgibacillus oceani]